MDATFYEDSARYDESARAALKRPATLDLGGRGSSKKPRVNALLTSPDLHMLKLESPELEKLIMQQHAPHQQPCMYPRDREDFPDALGGGGPFAPLYQHHPDPNGIPLPTTTAAPNHGAPPPSSMVDNPYGYPPQHHQPPLSNGCATSLPMVSSSANCYPTTNGYGYHHPGGGVVSVKEEPQTVPCASPHLGAPPRSPIDMEDQERLKLERKRLRNRIAASKCRRRKLERIARLEDRVALLKGENAELAAHVTRLKEHVCRLKEQVLEHVRHGCEILVAPHYAPQDL